MTWNGVAAFAWAAEVPATETAPAGRINMDQQVPLTGMTYAEYKRGETDGKGQVASILTPVNNIFPRVADGFDFVAWSRGES